MKKDNQHVKQEIDVLKTAVDKIDLMTTLIKMVVDSNEFKERVDKIIKKAVKEKTFSVSFPIRNEIYECEHTPIPATVKYHMNKPVGTGDKPVMPSFPGTCDDIKSRETTTYSLQTLANSTKKIFSVEDEIHKERMNSMTTPMS